VHLGEERPGLLLGQKLEAPLEDAAAVRVGRELKDLAGKGGDKVETGLGQGDDPLDDVIGVGRLDAVHNIVLELRDEDIALLARDNLERLGGGDSRGVSALSRKRLGTVTGETDLLDRPAAVRRQAEREDKALHRLCERLALLRRAMIEEFLETVVAKDFGGRGPGSALVRARGRPRLRHTVGLDGEGGGQDLVKDPLALLLGRRLELLL